MGVRAVETITASVIRLYLPGQTVDSRRPEVSDHGFERSLIASEGVRALK
jgi:hypothetical protein